MYRERERGGGREGEREMNRATRVYSAQDAAGAAAVDAFAQELATEHLLAHIYTDR